MLINLELPVDKAWEKCTELYLFLWIFTFILKSVILHCSHLCHCKPTRFTCLLSLFYLWHFFQTMRLLVDYTPCIYVFELSAPSPIHNWFLAITSYSIGTLVSNWILTFCQASSWESYFPVCYCITVYYLFVYLPTYWSIYLVPLSTYLIVCVYFIYFVSLCSLCLLLVPEIELLYLFMQKSYKKFETGDKIIFCFFCFNEITLAELLQSPKGKFIAKLTKDKSKNSELLFCFQYSVFYWDRVY